MLIVVLLFVILAILIAIITWRGLTDRILVIIPEGFVFGENSGRKRPVSIQYRDVIDIDVDGSMVTVIWEEDRQRKKRIDCRWFEASSREVASAMIEAYNAFKAKKRRRHR